MSKCLSKALFACFLLTAFVEGGIAKEATGNVTHVVLVWLKEPENPEVLERFIRGSKRLAMLPGVLYHRVGPSLPSDREIVDSSFDVGVTITLKDQEALKAYLEHPVHKQTIREVMRPLVRKIMVYDFVAR